VTETIDTPRKPQRQPRLRPRRVTRRYSLPSGLLPVPGTGLLVPPQHIQPIARVRFYIDTVEAFLFSTRQNDRKRLHDTFRGEGWWYNEIEHEERITGYQAKLQLPQQAVMRELSDMLLERRGYNDDTPGSITRLDYSADFEPLGEYTVKDVERWVLAHLIIPHRRRGEVLRHINTRYFNPNAHLNDKTNSRDVALYSDKPSKYLSRVENDRRPVCHLDLRMRGKRTIEAEGIRTLADAINKPPLEVLFSHVYFTSTDIEPIAREWIQERYTPTPTDEKTIIRFAAREQVNLAQRVKERLGIPMPIDPCPPLVISQRLNWLPMTSCLECAGIAPSPIG
jgi:hypothetical protein